MEADDFVEKRVVLVGAGNAHIQVVRERLLSPQGGSELILINASDEIPYSAMVPGFLSGEYRREECYFDLVKLCAQAKVRFIQGEVESIDLRERRLTMSDRPPMEFDVISINVGSLPTLPLGAIDSATCFGAKPLSRLVERIEAFAKVWESSNVPRSLAVVGAGAGGLEIALALKKRWVSRPYLKVTVFEQGDRLIPSAPRAVSKRFAESLRTAGVAFRVNTRVVEMKDGLVLDGGERVAADTVIFLTHPSVHPVMRSIQAEKDEAGFLKVSECLQSVSSPFLFAAGDCSHFPSSLPKAGVYAVRQGPILAENLRRAVRGQPLVPYSPQRRFLTLFNTANGSAILAYGRIGLSGRWVRRWKERIDRKWVSMFRMEPTMAMEKMHCGGCGSKLDAISLDHALTEVKDTNPDILVGVADKEDAAIIRRESWLVEGVSVDFFRSFIDDPFLLGQVAALNALNDLWAKNLVPKTALSLIAVPFAHSEMQRRWVSELLLGAEEVLDQYRVSLVGGHTTQSRDLMVGFTVSGTGTENRLFLKRGLRVGDVLILTKELGSGVLLAQHGRGACAAAEFAALREFLLRSNAPAIPVLAKHNVQACTDISGFGFARHLYEMLSASGLSARIFLDAIPALPGALEAFRNGVRSDIHVANEKATLNSIQGDTTPLLFDPQTSGGLLFGVEPQQLSGLQSELEAKKVSCFVIGEVLEKSEPSIHLERRKGQR